MEIILHCSDSVFGSAVMIDQWHAANGWKNPDGIHIGYHYVILNGQLTAKKFSHFCDGLLETGRALDDDGIFEWDEMAAATVGKNNCVQICMIGKSGKFTPAQLERLGSLLLDLWAVYKIIHVSQHSDHDPVNRPYCAGFTANQLKSFNIQ